ncbi:hypothetical protein BC826DRAFT_51305 [Russula brevipes]|nr:hypothetical protein BC826DRAFT_51305 [Russula brevipes]
MHSRQRGRRAARCESARSGGTRGGAGPWRPATRRGCAAGTYFALSCRTCTSLCVRRSSRRCRRNTSPWSGPRMPRALPWAFLPMRRRMASVAWIACWGIRCFMGSSRGLARASGPCSSVRFEPRCTGTDFGHTKSVLLFSSLYFFFVRNLHGAHVVFFSSFSHPLGFCGASLFPSSFGHLLLSHHFFSPPRLLSTSHCFGIGILHCRISHCFCFFFPSIRIRLVRPFCSHSMSSVASSLLFFVLVLRPSACCVTIRLFSSLRYRLEQQHYPTMGNRHHGGQ